MELEDFSEATEHRIGHKKKTAIVVLVNMALKVNTNKVFMKFQNKFLFYNFRAMGSTV